MKMLDYCRFGWADLGVGRKVPVLIALLAVSVVGCTLLPQSVSKGLLAEPGISAPGALSAQASPVGDIGRGQDLFMGNVHFQNGGPPCMGCHNVDSNGILGGGALGPDLTNVSARYSQSDLAAILGNPKPTMKPIFSEHPLTAGEQADLLAFLQASAGQPETNREMWVMAISLAGLLAAAGLAGVIYRGRLRGVRKPLVKQARSSKS